MERFFEAELKAGKTVNLKIEVGYPAAAGARPNSFTVKALIDGKPWIKDFNQ